MQRRYILFSVLFQTKSCLSCKMNFFIFKPQIPNQISHQSSCRLPNTRSSNARWADCDTSSAGHPCTAQRSLPSSQSSTPRNTRWRTLVSSHHCRLHAQHRCIARRTPLNINKLGTSWHFPPSSELQTLLNSSAHSWRVQNICFFSSIRSWSPHGYDHNSIWTTFWSKNCPPHPVCYRGGRGGGSGTNGGSKWNTCGGTALDAKLARKRHPVVWKWPQICPFGAKNDFFCLKWATLGPFPHHLVHFSGKFCI